MLNRKAADPKKDEKLNPDLSLEITRKGKIF